MFDTCLEKEGSGSAASTLTPSQLATDDGQLTRWLRAVPPTAGRTHVSERQRVSAANAHRKSRRLKMGYAGTGKAGVDVPYLRLRGRWLEEVGFGIGRRVRVEVSEGRLMIEAVD